MSMKKCKDCGEEISTKAKKCPKCGLDQRNWIMQHKVISVIGIIIWLCIISAIIGGTENKDSKQASNSIENQNSTKILKIGDEITVGNFAYKVNSVKNKKTIGSGYLTKNTNANFLIINISAKNVSNESRYLNNSLFKLKTQDGKEYDSSADFLGYEEGGQGGKFFLNQINPGIQVDGNLIFEVPKKSTEENYTLELSGGMTSYKTAMIELY